jgi:NAD-dependent dihydropyrimidine dehydrogenase PreA subunit
MVDDPRQRHGHHTWDMIINYHQCPKCGKIVENRNQYEYRLSHYELDLVCDRCQHHFTKTKRATFGPLLGND